VAAASKISETIMRRVPGFGLGIACALALASGRGAADPSDADRITARALAEEGRVALERFDYLLAEDRFTRADALIHAPTLMLGLARAQARLGKLVEAHESYQRIVREGVRPGSPPAFSRALDDATREVGPIAARLAWITIDVSPSNGAAVVLDGTAMSKAAIGAKRPVNPGTHRIRAMAPGYQARDETFSVTEAQKLALTLVLKPVATAELPGPGLPGTEPRASASDRKDDARPAIGGGPVDADVDAPRPGSANRIAAGVAFVLGGGGLVTGAVAGGLALRKHDSLERACPGGACGTEHREDIDDFRRLAKVSTIGFIVGAAGVSTGFVLLLTAPSDKRPAASAGISAYVGPGIVGMRGQF